MNPGFLLRFTLNDQIQCLMSAKSKISNYICGVATDDSDKPLVDVVINSVTITLN